MEGSKPSPVFILRKDPLLRMRLKTAMRPNGRRKTGTVGNFEGTPSATLVDSSMMRATCSATWEGDHFPGARGTSQNGAAASTAASRLRTPE